MKRQVCFLFMAFAMVSCNDNEFTRGIGVYPGKVQDYTGPEQEYSSNAYRNLAQNRAAWGSSSYDYNLTAHLATDGILSDRMPLLLNVQTSDGTVSKLYRDLLFDGNDKRSFKVRNVEGAFVRADFQNLTIDCDKVTLETGDSICEVKVVDGHVFEAELPETEGEWIELKLMHFYKDGKEFSVYSSEFFSSCWVPESCCDEWIYVDLGSRCKFDRIVLDWIGDAPCGRVEVSDDTSSWRELCPIGENAEIEVSSSARYVRVYITDCPHSQMCALSEMQVWGRGGVVLKPSAQPKAKGNVLNLRGGDWKVQRASEVASGPEDLSRAGFDDESWLLATVPGTVQVSYLNAGAIPDQRYDDDQLQISESFFLSDFWYRDEFDIPSSFESGRMLLDFEGINWKADIWVNGKLVGNVDGAFMRGQFDVTELIDAGQRNAIAVLIHRNAHPGGCKQQTRMSADSNGGYLGSDNPTFNSTVGWDWIPTVRGRNIGIWKDVTISAHKAGVSIRDPFVVTDLPLPSTDYAVIGSSITVSNHNQDAVSGELVFRFADLEVSEPVYLDLGEERVVSIPSFRMENPELWWPEGYGQAHLYDASMTFVCKGEVSDRIEFKTGVREMSYDDSDGSLDIYVNGRRLIGNGGNWGFPEINLGYRGREYDIAVAYHADMGFNLIRNWVGQTGDREFYEACDRHGVMVWQDFWLANPWDGPDPLYGDMFMSNASDYIRRIRNHPCIALYCGRNEGMPPAEIDKQLSELVSSSHPGSHYISHSAAIPVSGYGPYWALGPDRYFELEEGRGTLHSERGMPNVMNFQNVQRMLRERNQWPQNSVWGLHDYTLESAQQCATFNGFVRQAFGEPKNLEQFTKWAQWVNYDGYRAMYESRSPERKGLLIWMSHPCWPSMVWQTYDYYFEPTAAYFGAKKACAPVRIQYNPSSGQVEVVNNCARDRKCLRASVRILDINGKQIWEKESCLDSNEDTTVPVCALPLSQLELTDVYYIKLALYQEDTLIADNFYVRGKEYYDFKKLLELGDPSIRVKCDFRLKGSEYSGTAVVENTGTVPALMVRLCLVRKADGELILPVFYQDNYISLMPREKREIVIRFRKEDTGGQKPVLIWETGI